MILTDKSFTIRNRIREIYGIDNYEWLVVTSLSKMYTSWSLNLSNSLKRFQYVDDLLSNRNPGLTVYGFG